MAGIGKSLRTSKDYNLKLKYRNILKYEDGIFWRSIETDQTALYEQSGLFLYCLIIEQQTSELNIGIAGIGKGGRTSEDYNLKLKYRNILKYEDGIFWRTV